MTSFVRPDPSLRLLAVLACVTAASSSAGAQDGTYDTSWFADGRLNLNLDFGNDYGEKLLIQPDGKLMLAGTCNERLCIARFQPDGQLDGSFGGNQDGTAVFSALPGRLADAAALPGGAVILVGETGTVARVTSAGWNDLSTTLSLSSSTRVAAVAVQADGKILVGGHYRFDGHPSDIDFFVARLRPDFTLDPAFGGGGVSTVWFDLSAGRQDYLGAMDLLPDGRILLAGVAQAATAAWPVLAQLLPTGQRDAAFGDQGDGTQVIQLWDGAETAVGAVTRDRGGRILFAGDVNDLGGTSRGMYVIRTHANGALDPSFGLFGWAPVSFDAGGDNNDLGQALAVQSDGKILVGGWVDTGPHGGYGASYWGLARMLPDGQYDPTFGSGGRSIGTFTYQFHPGDPVYYSDLKSMAFGNGGLMIAGWGESRPSFPTDEVVFALGLVQLDLIFTDGFQP